MSDYFERSVCANGSIIFLYLQAIKAPRSSGNEKKRPKPPAALNPLCTCTKNGNSYSLIFWMLSLPWCRAWRSRWSSWRGCWWCHCSTRPPDWTPGGAPTIRDPPCWAWCRGSISDIEMEIFCIEKRPLTKQKQNIQSLFELQNFNLKANFLQNYSSNYSPCLVGSV